MELSFFKGFTDTMPESITMEALVAMMRTDQSVRDFTEKHRYYRAMGDMVSAKYYKRRMPCFGVAARFVGGRRKEHITGLTGLSLVDIDHIPAERMGEVLALVQADEHTLLAYTTLSGQGLRILFRYTVNKTTDCPDYTDLLTGGSSTPNTNNLSNPRNLRLNKASIKTTDCSDYTDSSTDGSSAPQDNNQCNPRNLCNLWLDNQEYRRVFEQGNEYYSNLLNLPYDGQCKNVGRLSTIAYDADLYYNPDAVAFAISEEKKRPVGRPRCRCHAADVEKTVLARVEAQGVRYEPHSHNGYIARVCYEMNRLGVPEEECVTWAVAKWPDYAATDNVPAIVRSCYQQTTEHGTARPPRTNSNVPYATIEQIQRYLTERGICIRHNVVTRKEEIRVDTNEDENEDENEKWDEFTDKQANSLHCRFCLDTGLRLHESDLYVVIGSDFYPDYNPFADYLQRLSPWDGVTDHIELLASRVRVAGDAQELHNRCLRKWLVAMLATWLHDDVVNHEILTYIGRQGIYKSSFMRELLPPELRRYFSTRNFALRMDKDARIELSEAGLVCLEELDHMKTAEVNQLKAIVTETHINERASYGRYKERRAHIASFCGTGNNPRFLSDPTGNRRWLPFMVENIVSPYAYPFDYTGIYSQAYALLKSGFVYWFTEEENAELEQHNHHFEEPSMEEELILTYLAKPYGDYKGEFLTATRIVELVGGCIRQPLSPRRIAYAMNRLGFAPRRINNLRGWVAVILTGDQIKADQRSNAVNSGPDVVNSEL